MVELSQSYYPSLLLAEVLSSMSPRRKYILLKVYNKIKVYTIPYKDVRSS